MARKKHSAEQIVTVLRQIEVELANHKSNRATYTNHSATHFTWRGDASDDRKRWSEFMTIDAYRLK